MTVARDLAAILTEVQYADLPQAATTNAKKVLVSTLASAAVGSTIRSAQIVRETAGEHAGNQQATAWFSNGLRLPLPAAVRLNAVLSDSAASDDSDIRTIAHTGTQLTAMSLAAAEWVGASGRDVLCAIVAGYEASGRIGEAVWPALERRGFHASAVVAFGGVIAGARLLGLDRDETAHALSLAATSVGGLTVSTHSWAREYQAGNAALVAANAVLAAGNGFTANPDMFETRGGFFDVFGGGHDAAERVLEDVGEWDICSHLAIKVWPGATPLAAAVEAAINATIAGDIDPADVVEIHVSGPSFTSLYGHRLPTDMAGAIHSTTYYLASAVVDRDFNWTHVAPEKLSDPRVAQLQDLVAAIPDSDPSRHSWEWGATVSITLRNGREFRSTVNEPKGSAPRGIEWDDVEHKVRTLVPQAGASSSTAEAILDLGRRFDELATVTPLIDLLSLT